jgi:hypothetical protein
MVGQVRCLRFQTTLYELIQTLQEEVAADDDQVVVALVTQWINEGRIKASRATCAMGWELAQPLYDRHELYRVSMGRAS